MEAIEIENNMELQRILWACYEYWRKESLAPHERSICYTWVVKVYRGKFGTKFHQAALRRLVKLGFLQPDKTSQSGNRRYYRIVNPTQIGSLLQKFDINQ